MGTTNIRAFKPFKVNGTANLAVTASSQTLAIPAGVGVGTPAVRVANVGTQTIFIDFGLSTGTASTSTSMPILANTVEVFSIVNDVTHLAVIAGSTGSTVYLTVGEGL